MGKIMFHLYHIKHKMLDCCVVVSCSVVSDSFDPWTVACQAPLSRDFLGKNTGVGNHFLLQGIFPTQGWNLYLLRCRQILYCWATREALFVYQLSHICLMLRMTRGIQHTRSLITSVIIPTETNTLELNKDALESI